MEIHSVVFESDDHRRMAKVLSASAAENSPETPLVLHEITDPDDDLKQLGGKLWHSFNYIENARKTRHHRNIVEEAQEGALLCLMDCDCIVWKSLSDVEEPVDLSLTLRPGGLPNTGVYFVRANDMMRRFMRLWDSAVRMLLQSEEMLIEYRQKYGGINQAALGYLCELHDTINQPAINTMPCEIWNCTPECIDKFSLYETKVVHLMGWFRDMCLGTRPVPEELREKGKHILAEWQKYDAQH